MMNKNKMGAMMGAVTGAMGALLGAEIDFYICIRINERSGKT